MALPERRELLPQLSEERTRPMVATIFDDHLLPDLEDIFAARKFVGQAQVGTLGELNPQLLELQKKLLIENAGGSLEEIKDNSVRSYLDYRRKFQAGLTDRYGRPAFLQTVPSESDSASHTVIFDMECPDDDLVSEGDLYQVYTSKHKVGRFSALRGLGKFMGDDEGTIVSGTKVVVPLGPWAGHSVSIFVPEDRSHALMWIYDTHGRIVTEDLASQMIEPVGNIISSGNINYRDAAMLYAVQAISTVLPTDQRVRRAVLSAMGRLNVEKPDEELNQILEAVGEYPKLFKPAEKGSLAHIQEYQTALAATANPSRQAENILADPDKHFRDPGLLAFAIREMLSGDTYPKFVAKIYARLNQFMGELDGIAVPTRDVLLDHFRRHDILKRFGNVAIPWQTKFIFGDAEYAALRDRVKAIDPKFEDFRDEFSFFHVPMEMLPEEAASRTEHIEEEWGFMGFGSENSKKRYFDMNGVFNDYQSKIVELTKQLQAAETPQQQTPLQ